MIYVGKFIDLKRRNQKDQVPISIVKKAPPWYTAKKWTEYKPLAADDGSSDSYNAKLATMDAIKIVNRLLYLSKQKDPILTCYEEWQCECVKNWLIENGFECTDLISPSL